MRLRLRDPGWPPGGCLGCSPAVGTSVASPSIVLPLASDAGVASSPGLGNGIANLHNARRARTPIVNIVGDQATYHRAYDAPLTSDIDALARNVSGWIRDTTQPQTVARDAVDT